MDNNFDNYFNNIDCNFNQNNKKNDILSAFLNQNNNFSYIDEYKEFIINYIVLKIERHQLMISFRDPRTISLRKSLMSRTTTILKAIMSSRSYH